MKQLNNGDSVTVVLHGDDGAYVGRVIKSRKLWVELPSHPFSDKDGAFIADESSIKEVLESANR